MQLIKYILLSLSLLLCFCSPAESKADKKKYNRVNKKLLQLNQNEGLVYFNGEIYTGEAFRLYPNGQVEQSLFYLKGKKNDTIKKYYSDGNISYIANYNKGKLDGESKSWWKNGNLRPQTFFKNGKVTGELTQWYKSGKLFKKLHYKENKEEGMQQAWRENGAIYNNYEAKNGRIFGLKRANLCYELEDEIVQYDDK